MPLKINADKLPERSYRHVHRLVKCRPEPCDPRYIQPSWGGRPITQIKLDWEALSYQFNKDETCPVCQRTGCQIRHRTVNVYSNPDNEAANKPNDESSAFGQLAAAFRAIGCPWGENPEKYEGQIFETEDRQIAGSKAKPDDPGAYKDFQGVYRVGGFWQTVPIKRLDSYEPPTDRPTFNKTRDAASQAQSVVAPPPAPDELEAYVVIADAMDGVSQADAVGVLAQKVPNLAREPYLSKALNQTLFKELVARGLGEMDEETEVFVRS